MTIKYRLVPMKFDADGWAEVMRQLSPEMVQTVAEITDLSPSTLRHWLGENYATGFEYPSMTNFLLICNLLDLDPSTFFILKETAHNGD